MAQRVASNLLKRAAHGFRAPKRFLEAGRNIRDRAAMDAELLGFMKSYEKRDAPNGPVLLDATWDNPHYWYRISLMLAAHGRSPGPLRPILGEWRLREISATLKSWNTAQGIKLSDAMPLAAQSTSEARELLRNTSRPGDILHWKLPADFPQTVLYDTLLKEQRRGVVDLEDGNLEAYVAKLIGYIHAAGKIVAEDSYELALFSHNIGEMAAPLAWCSMKAGIPSYVLYSHFGVQRFLRLEGPEQFRLMATAPSPEMLAGLTEVARDRLRLVGQQYMKARFSGRTVDLAARLAYGENPSSRPADVQGFAAQFGWSEDKPMVCVYVSNWYDYPHSLGVGRYRDFMEWFEDTLDVARQADHVNWLIRDHPLDRRYGVDLSRTATAMARNLNVGHVAACPVGVDGKTVQAAIVGAITCAGSIGLEMPYLGKPVLAADIGWYGKCGFVTLPKDPEDYKRLLATNWWEGIDLDQRKRRAEIFAGIYYGCPEWQAGLITLDDSRQWELYGPVIRLVREASVQMNREVDMISKWLGADTPHYHHFKMLEAERYGAATLDNSILAS